jgi:hypothetical protein
LPLGLSRAHRARPRWQRTLLPLPRRRRRLTLRSKLRPSNFSASAIAHRALRKTVSWFGDIPAA